MAWKSSGTSNEELVKNLVRNGIIQTETVRKVCAVYHSQRIISQYRGLPQSMLSVDRANYVVDKGTAYEDSPQ